MPARANNLKFGDILEVRTKRGLAYVQYVNHKKPLGTLIRILPNFYQQRPADFSRIAQEKELYFVFCAIEILVRKNLIDIVSNENIPNWAKPFPIMRKRGFTRPIANGGGVSHWTIVDGEKVSRVEKLNSKQAKLSIISAWSLQTLVLRLEQEWRPSIELGQSGAGS